VTYILQSLNLYNLIRAEFVGRCTYAGAVNASFPKESHVGRNNLYCHHVPQLRPHHRQLAVPDAHSGSPLRRASVSSAAPPFVRCSERGSADYHTIRPRGFHVFERSSLADFTLLFQPRPRTLPKAKPCSEDDVKRMPCLQRITLIQIVVSVFVHLRLS